jgi:hypothetical protein
MKTGTTIALSVIGGLAVVGLGFGAYKLTQRKPAPEVSSAPPRVSAPAPAPAPTAAPAPAPAAPMPSWANNVNAALSITNNLVQTGLGLAKQLGF